jgi:hypothetical protein
VIVVDDGSAADPAYVVDTFKGDLNLTLVRRPGNRGPAAHTAGYLREILAGRSLPG